MLKRPHHKLIATLTGQYDVKLLECSALENEDVINCFETVAKRIHTDEKFTAYDKDMNDKEKMAETSVA